VLTAETFLWCRRKVDVRSGTLPLPALQEEARKRQATSTGGAHPQLTAALQEAASGEAAVLAAEIVKVGIVPASVQERGEAPP
jgi:hypothetical protein